MITLRKSADRGFADYGWLKTYHTFSFADYFDRKHMNFRSLRVINEDFVAPAKGFGTHPHDNMEILTYVVSGQLSHKDSMGNGRTIKAGELQYMSAGTGVTHSEFNSSQREPVHLLQIWITPKQRGLNPTYAEWLPGKEDRTGKVVLLASEDGRDGSVMIRQDARLYLVTLGAGEDASIPADGLENGWVQIISGSGESLGETLEAGDGAQVTSENAISLSSGTGLRALVFRLN